MLLFWTWHLMKPRVLNHSWLFRNNFSTSFQFIDQSFHLEKILCVFFSKQNVRRQTTVEMKEWLVCKWLRAFVLFDPLAKVPSRCLSYFLNKNYQLQFTSVALTAGPCWPGLDVANLGDCHYSYGSVTPIRVDQKTVEDSKSITSVSFHWEV